MEKEQIENVIYIYPAYDIQDRKPIKISNVKYIIDSTNIRKYYAGDEEHIRFTDFKATIELKKPNNEFKNNIFSHDKIDLTYVSKQKDKFMLQSYSNCSFGISEDGTIIFVEGQIAGIRHFTQVSQTRIDEELMRGFNSSYRI
jgi:hypothetical protein